MRLRNVVIILGLALLAAGPLAAQETTGRIEGRIIDPQSLPVPGVTVTATGPQGEKLAITDTDGRFTLPFLTPGIYQLRAELQSFKTIQKNDINVSLGQTVDVALQLEVGEIYGDDHRVRRRAPNRYEEHHNRRRHRQRLRAHCAGRAANQRHQLPGPGRQQLRIGRATEPVDFRRQRS